MQENAQSSSIIARMSIKQSSSRCQSNSRIAQMSMKQSSSRIAQMSIQQSNSILFIRSCNVYYTYPALEIRLYPLTEIFYGNTNNPTLQICEQLIIFTPNTLHQSYKWTHRVLPSVSDELTQQGPGW